MDAYLIHRVMIKKKLFDEEIFFTSMRLGQGREKGKFDEEMQNIIINKGLVNGH